MTKLKKLNYFIYITIAKHCSVIKLGELTLNTLSHKSGNPGSLENNHKTWSIKLPKSDRLFIVNWWNVYQEIYENKFVKDNETPASGTLAFMLVVIYH